MLLAILAEGVDALVGQQLIDRCRETIVVQGDRICGNLFQADTADVAGNPSEIAVHQIPAQADRLKQLSPPVATDRADTHLAQHLLQAFADRLDIVLLCGVIVELNLLLADQVVEDGEGHVGTDGTGTEAQQQGGVHHLAQLAGLHHQSGLHALLHGDQMMVHGADRQERWNDCLLLIHVPVAQDDVVDTLIHRLFRLAAQLIERAFQTGVTLLNLKQGGQLHTLKTFVADVAENV